MIEYDIGLLVLFFLSVWNPTIPYRGFSNLLEVFTFHECEEFWGKNEYSHSSHDLNAHVRGFWLLTTFNNRFFSLSLTFTRGTFLLFILTSFSLCFSCLPCYTIPLYTDFTTAKFISTSTVSPYDTVTAPTTEFKPRGYFTWYVHTDYPKTCLTDGPKWPIRRFRNSVYFFT